MVNGMVVAGLPQGGIRIESYQGERARRYLVDVGAQERRYQQERKAQPFN